MIGSRYLAEIERLDPERDHKRIVYLDTSFEFPFDITRALEMALFRTFAVPSISKILAESGEFFARAQKRYDDTDLIISFMLEDGYDSEAGMAAMRHMNAQHARFDISNDDFLYVLSTFIFEPIKWIEAYGWRPMHINEKLAMYHCWVQIGRRMGIQDIPATSEAFHAWSKAYEAEHFVFSETNQQVGSATRDLFLSWGPGFLSGFGSKAIYAMMDEPLLDAFGFPHPSSGMRSFVNGMLRLRAFGVRWMPKRSTPRIRTTARHRSYPEGYQLEDLGPPGD